MDTNIKREITDAGVAVLIFDRPNSPANIFDQQTFAELNEHLTFLEQQPGIKGLVIRSAKPKIFIAGADLTEFGKDFSAEGIGAMIERGQKAFDRIEKLPFPTVAAIHGTALGGGLEISLACDYRVASLDPSTKLGLPETNLGILPGWGGSTRLPRLIALPEALDMILSGRQVVAKQALKMGLIDAVAYPERLFDLALKQLKEKRDRKKNLKFQIINRSPLSKVIISQAEKKTLSKTHWHYPAPIKALRVVEAGLSASHEQSLANEKRGLIELAQGPVSENLVRIFFLQERSKKLELPTSQPIKPVKKALVIGAGLMGSGIAQWLSASGIKVILKDIKPEFVSKGVQNIAKIYRDAVKRKVFTEAEAKQGIDRILPVFEDIPLREIDLVIEAAVEKLELKQAIFKDLEAKLPQGTLLATNTSALSIDEIAQGLSHPENVVGIHFFNPVHRMQLVEIVKGAHTAPDILAKATEFVKQIRKLPVLAKDSPGFLVNRILIPGMVEAIRLFNEGYSLTTIDQVLLDFGMPMGPLRLTDEVGLDVAQHVSQDLSRRLSHIPETSDILGRMIAKGWMGRKSGTGFYVYQGKDERPNPQLNLFQPTPLTAPNVQLIKDRLVLVMINESARVLEEKVAESAADIDFGMIMGTGWAPFRGGPMKYADTVGIQNIVNRLNELKEQAGTHFAPCQLLVDMAERNEKFFS
jgi:3-hydroxyacyl-CoA dehydrogenase / enoyl-CoA hydratase / 3-hydroxybutyryl-CoA epimerase